VRVRRNADPRIRRAERAVGAGDASAIPELIRNRLRAGEINPRLARAAKFFSAPLTPPGSTAGSYNWHPFNWSYNELKIAPHEYAQDERTLVLHSALVRVLGARMKLPTDWSAAADNWMDRLGFVVSDTGGVGNHAPFEIQSEDTVERETELEGRRVEDRQLKLASQFHMATGGDAVVSDQVFMWLVKRDLFLGRANAISVMKYLRMNSTVEYCNVLGANVYDQRDRKDPPFGLTEYELVSSYLGGAPL
jgi:hypothetical protein